MNEAETRAEYIDLALAAAGWRVVEGSRIRRKLLDGLAEKGFGRDQL
jgi:type I restriction enzyme R subunit